MCTVSWLREPGAFQLFFNRDERRSRKPAVPPAVLRKGDTRFIAPRDGDFGGSWLGVNEHGLSLCLLNGYVADDETASGPAGGHTSRGLLLTDLIDAVTLAELRERLGGRDLTCFRSFLLAGFEPALGSLLAEWKQGGLRFRSPIEHLNPLVSSSFATEDVKRSRIGLFREMLQDAGTASERLHLDFHTSHLPSSGPYSPCMHRPEAHTVSFSRVRVAPGQVRFEYAGHSPCRGLPERPVATLEGSGG